MTPKRRGRPRTNPALITRAIALMDDGASAKEAAQTVGVHQTTILRHTIGRERWTYREAGSLGRAVRIHSQKVSRA